MLQKNINKLNQAGTPPLPHSSIAERATYNRVTKGQYLLGEPYAGVMELEYILVLKTNARMRLRDRGPSPAPINFIKRSCLIMAYIYKIVNDINEKVYIGKTMNSISERWREHLSDMNKIKNEKRPLYNAMRKYGSDHFSIEEIEKCNLEDLNQKERYWIEYYNSYKYGYNATLGGDGKAYADTTVILGLWEKGKNIKEIQGITGYDGETIKNHLEGSGITAKDRKKRGQQKQSKPVLQLDKDTNKIIKSFSSIAEAAESINKSTRHIAEVCHHKRKTAYGYKWIFVEE